MSKDVHLSYLPAAGGKRLLCIRIEAPERLNTLRQETTAAIGDAVRRADQDESVVFIWIEGGGKKAFCAGGDVRMLSGNYRKGEKESVLHFFTTEYSTDYAIHMAKTPILCFAHGIVMGGGMGILAGCRHKVLTPDVVLAMPEVSIGLFPDVGATWFLNRMPRGCGRLLGLCGYRMDAADACFLGFGDRVVQQEDRDALFESLAALDWTGNPERDAQAVDAVLAHFELPLEPGFLAEKPECLRKLALAPDPVSFGEILLEAGKREPRLMEASKTFGSASPFSICLTWRQLGSGRHLSLKQAFCLELILAARCLEHPDFHEGVRALLVDKDGAPVWKDSRPEKVDPSEVRHCFTPPWSSLHPLKDLPEPALISGWS
ncbi:enoyl-CoA hydratase/carnithine racemase [Desulfobotulus alkaliphilus]|uniref:3-hydroxyisobutyryl-CoA hydrolase n=1 Tax=Desulfobotulus alkaliphilus TaxID=622671 RepID=A0A562RNN1_9BACT|nr:enoyl-CoA hydratase/isomerase family protein [Desulfobotulus alkaliphilus]TWI70667.1 enoyl-CoA hydratase/carnithine racemase [Desulfobotulus alkaliphilus]